MSNPSKAKGTSWERAIVDYLKPHFPHVERRTLSGAQDKGDIAGIPGVVIEAKNTNRVELATWVTEATKEAANAGAHHGVVWAHRRGKSSPADGYVIMTGAVYLRLIKEAGW